MGNDNGLKISIVIERATKIEIKRNFNDYVFFCIFIQLLTNQNCSINKEYQWSLSSNDRTYCKTVSAHLSLSNQLL